MTNKPYNPKITEIRRTVKAMDDETWIKSFLQQVPTGVLATAVEDQPFLSPKLFVFDETKHAIFFHSADEGRVWTNIHLNPKVCFTAYEMDRLIPSQKACSFGLEYRSVVVFGTIRIVDHFEEAISVMHLFMEKYAPHLQVEKDYSPVTADGMKGMVVYQLEIQGWSGKQDQRKDDLQRAYRYEAITKGAPTQR
jgi:nitroimidazol reductase NimA-like FMN-containing flavoprotein (pyridoxamine 5'-phosphate oxidase superfamily)